MTRPERRLWEAVYAAAFVSHRYRMKEVAAHLGKEYEIARNFDEEAADCADAAIEGIRDWLKTEGPGDSEYLNDITHDESMRKKAAEAIIDKMRVR